MGEGTGNGEPNLIQPHAAKDRMSVGRFTKSVDAFTGPFAELVKDTSDSVSWMRSVESGSTRLYAEHISDDGEVTPDVTPVFNIVRDNASMLAGGKNAEKVPAIARQQYAKLVKAVGKNADGKPAGLLALAYDSPSERREMPLDELGSEETSGPATYTSVGSITGYIYSMSSKKHNAFTITDRVTGQPIRGSYDDDLLDCFKHASRTRATVSGIVAYDLDGRIRSIKASAARVEPANVPQPSTLRGILEG